MNELATEIADGMAEQAALLRVRAPARSATAPGSSTAACDMAGGYDAGPRPGRDLHGRARQRRAHPVAIGDESWPGVTVWTDHPAVSCMASQYAGWAISVDKFFAMGSGPLRAHARVEKELFEKLGYAEKAEHGVLVLEGRALPTDAVAEWVAEKARLQPSPAHLRRSRRRRAWRAACRSRPGSSRPALHKMETLGFDCRRVVSAMGIAPIPPVAKNDLRAIGRTNDCILYGGQAHYTVRAGDDELAELAAKVPASASRDYGTPFYDIFQRYEGDFYKIDPLLFSPAEVWLTSTETRPHLSRRAAQPRGADARRAIPPEGGLYPPRS